MLKRIIIILVLFSTLLVSQTNEYSKIRKSKFAFGAQVGMFNGFGGQINFLTSNFADNFPLAAKLSIGISFLDPGDPLAARRVFINDNSSGIPEKSGSIWSFGLDFMYRYSILNLKRNYFYFGPRYTMFTGNFNFIGGNEDFDVTSDQWGLGAGVENYFRIISSIDLVLNFGLDYYFPNRLYGHDTSYTSEGEDINPRNNYSFSDADKAINQPLMQVRATIGFNYRIK